MTGLIDGMKAKIEESRRAMRQAMTYEMAWHAESLQGDKYGPQACADFARAASEWGARAERYMTEICDMERELSALEAKVAALEAEQPARAEEEWIWFEEATRIEF